jgi:hypothetical protein
MTEDDIRRIVRDEMARKRPDVSRDQRASVNDMSGLSLLGSHEHRAPFVLNMSLNGEPVSAIAARAPA